VRDITKSSAIQRAGRAGREVCHLPLQPSKCITTSQGEGFCFRLYTEESFNAMAASSEPEIRRCSLTSGILQLKCLGQNLEELDCIDSPEYDAGL
jgi:HrpA-like RNA helicase